MITEEKAVEYKHSGYNGCRAVVKTLTEQTNFDAERLNKLASGFAVCMGCMEAATAGCLPDFIWNVII